MSKPFLIPLMYPIAKRCQLSSVNYFRFPNNFENNSAMLHLMANRIFPINDMNQVNWAFLVIVD